MQAIKTKYLPATNYRGSRVKAVAERGSITVSFDHSMSTEQAHAEAARALVQKFTLEDAKRNGTPVEQNPWSGVWVCGSTDNTGYTFIRSKFANRYLFPASAEKMPEPEDAVGAMQAALRRLRSADPSPRADETDPVRRALINVLKQTTTKEEQ